MANRPACPGEHRARKGGDLLRCFPAGAQRDQEGGLELGRRLLGDQRGQNALDLQLRQRCSVQASVETEVKRLACVGVARGGARRPLRFPDRAHAKTSSAQRSRKFASSRGPRGVRMLSGWNCTPSAANSRWRSPLDLSFERVSRDLQRVRKSLLDDFERVVATRDEGFRQAVVQAASIVKHAARLPVARMPRALDTRSADLGQGLVSEANAQDREASEEGLDQFHGSSRGFGPTGTGRNDQVRGFERACSGWAELVVAMDQHLRVELPQRLNQVERERIEVVDQEHSRLHCTTSGARAKARRMAPPLARTSSYSAAGRLSDTMPAPAWKDTRPARNISVRMAMAWFMLP